MHKNVRPVFTLGVTALCLAVFSSYGWGATIGAQGDPKPAAKGQAKNLINTKVTHNRWEMYMTNQGKLVYNGTAYGGYWPAGSSHKYIYAAGLWVGAEVGGTKFVTEGYEPDYGTDEFKPSAINGDTTNDATALLYISGQGNWPLHKSGGGDSVVSELDTYTKFDDWDPAYHSPGGAPLKIKVSQTSYAWKRWPMQDVVFFTYEVQNTSGDSLKYVYLGACFDNDIGNEGGGAANDRVYFDVSRNMGIQFQAAPEPGWDTVGRVGVRFFESPVCTKSSVQIVDNQYPRTINQGQQLGMTAFKIFTIDIDPLTDNDQYLVMQGYNYKTMVMDAYDEGGFYNPGDKRFIMCAGPFDMKPDTTVRFVVGIVAATDSAKLAAVSDVAQHVYDNHFVPMQVTITNPGEHYILTGGQTVMWASAAPICTTDVYYSGDGGSTWNLIAAGQTGTSTSWYTQDVPDGVRYKIGAYSYNSSNFGWGESGFFTVDNAGNVAPQLQLNHSATNSGIVQWPFYYGDADDDFLAKSLSIQKSDWGAARWDTIATSSSFAQYWTLDSLSWNTALYPNNGYMVRVGVNDGSHAVAETMSIITDNTFPKADTATHVSGPAKWATMNPYVMNPAQLTGHIYEYRFKPIGGIYLSSTGLYLQRIMFDLWDVDLNTCVSSDRSFFVPMADDNVTIQGYYGPDQADGIVADVDYTYLMNQRCDSLRIVNDVGNFSQDTMRIVPADTNINQTPKWQFRGCDNEIRWHARGIYPNDTIWAEVWDMDNNVLVPLDTLGWNNLQQSAWSFGPTATGVGRSILANSITSVARKYMYLCGARLGFNFGNSWHNMTWSTHPEEGEVWKLYAHGPKPPREGDVYRFRGQLGVAGGPSAMAYRFGLQQNAPNPFSRMTEINYQISQPCRVQLRVYNIAGQLVKTLIDEQKTPQQYAVRWDGRNAGGQKLSAGVYLYRLQAGEKTMTRKLVLVR